MKVLLLAITLLFTLPSFSQNTCESIKDGRFYYPSMPGKITVREGAIQKSFSNGVLQATWSVKWVSDCKYILVCTNTYTEASPFQLGDKIIVTVVAVKEACYYSTLEVFNKQYPDGFVMDSQSFPLCWEVE